MQNRTVHFVGDSNMRLWWEVLVNEVFKGTGSVNYTDDFRSREQLGVREEAGGSRGPEKVLMEDYRDQPINCSYVVTSGWDRPHVCEVNCGTRCDRQRHGPSHLHTHTHTHTPVSYTHLTLPTSVAV